jgi:hypothetical protein
MWQAWTSQGEVGRDHLISKLPTAILQLGYWVFFLGAQVAGLGISILQVVDSPTAKRRMCRSGIHSNQEEATRMHPHENYKNKGF